MDVNYWNNFAYEYDDMVTDAFTYGRSNTIAAQIERLASPGLNVADFGCGPGKLLPWLATKFQKVYGYDFSNKLLSIAKKRCKGLTNVVIKNADLSRPVDRLPMVDVAVSLNAALMPIPTCDLTSCGAWPPVSKPVVILSWMCFCRIDLV